NVRASQARPGGRVTYSSSNRSYTNRLMATYASGLVDGGWAYTISVGRRWGNEGYQDATLYDSNSFFVSFEKKINDKHSLNFTSIYAPNRRGKSSPNTQEVFDLKGIKYNEYWGWQDGEKRNSRIKEVEEPIIMLNHYWTINDKTSLNTNVAYQFGKLGNSRIDYNGTSLTDGGVIEGGGANPSAAYYQLLPSYLLRNFPDNPEFAFGAQQDFVNNGQIDWNTLYQANIANAERGLNSKYILYEDRVDDTQTTINSILNTELSENIVLNASINYKHLKSENFAEVIDLLGGTGYLNVDGFDALQFDLQNPNQIVGEGDTFRYNYNLTADVISGYAQAQFKYNKVDFFLAASLTNTQYQREGLYENEANVDNSFGKGKKLTFTGIGAKGGFTYKITGKHVLDINAGYITRAPSLRNTYTNSRSNHDIININSSGTIIPGEGITEEKISSIDASYIFRSSLVKAKLTGFYTTIKDANEISFFYADGVGGFFDESGIAQSNEFISEVLQGIDKKHIGAEFGIEAQVTPTIKLKAAGSIGQYTYDNNPNLYVSADDQTVPFGESTLKDYKLAGGPQKAYSVGFEYRDPDYWWFGATANFFDDTYVDVSPLVRSANFYQDPIDGLPFNDYDEDIARELLRQEKFDSYMVVNLVGGKSWRVGDYYIGFFASIGNVFDKKYRTGGFEQGRNANYRELRDDKALNTPVFGPKYWYGRGTNYFLNVNFRF
ncbi:MAG: TonB-dependent receptor, partial [Bacteroidetes bacterium]|nr:TonB-dependent receptor [Bacteroidota bacterium]